MSRARIVRVLLSVHEHAEFGVGEIDYALVVVNAGRIRKYMKQISEVKRRKDVDYFSVFDYSPYWLGSDEDKLRAALIGDGDIEDAARVDCEMRKTSSTSIHWSAYYKHTNVALETDNLYHSVLEELMQVAEGKMELNDVDITNRNVLNLDLIDGLNICTT